MKAALMTPTTLDKTFPRIGKMRSGFRPNSSERAPAIKENRMIGTGKIDQF